MGTAVRSANTASILCDAVSGVEARTPKIIPKAMLKVSEAALHGLPTTHKDQLYSARRAFIRA
jgi:hypothetical protein